MQTGYPSPDHLMADMTGPQLVEMEAFCELEGGIGQMKIDYHFGQLCSLLANINRDTKSKPIPFTAEDFNLRPRVVVEASDNDIMAAFAGLTSKKKRR